MKKMILFFVLFLAPIPLVAQQPSMKRISHKIEATKQQYNEAFENVKIDTKQFASCLTSPTCNHEELKERARAIKTNLGTMAAALPP